MKTCIGSKTPQVPRRQTATHASLIRRWQAKMVAPRRQFSVSSLTLSISSRCELEVLASLHSLRGKMPHFRTRWVQSSRVLVCNTLKALQFLKIELYVIDIMRRFEDCILERIGSFLQNPHPTCQPLLAPRHAQAPA